MNYPLITEYVEAIKSSEENFEQLKNLRPVLDADGEPVFSSGNFAVVFKMKDEQTGKQHAVKCFLREQEGRAEAYRQIAEELEFVSSTFLTPIKYLDKELFVDTNAGDETEFPVLLMDWVEGETLDKYIRKHLDDQYELSLLAYQFSRMAMWLMPQPFAHGDLKPDNILVKNDGTLVLVDYDGMYVPAMKGQKARELGSPDFRHPNRTETDFDEHIDDFSLASILLSLKAISLQPSLLEEYGASDRLLFSEKDYRNLSESEIMDALKPLMQDVELTSLYSLFILASSQNNLSGVSFRLFSLSRPKRKSLRVLQIKKKTVNQSDNKIIKKEMLTSFQGKKDVIHFIYNDGTESWTTNKQKFLDEVNNKGGCRISTIDNDKVHVIYLYDDNDNEVGKYYIEEQLHGKAPKTISEINDNIIVIEVWSDSIKKWFSGIGIEKKISKELLSSFQGRKNVRHIVSSNGTSSYLTQERSFGDEAYAKGACKLNTVENDKKHVLFFFNDKDAEVGRYYMVKDLQGLTPSQLVEIKHEIVVFESWNPETKIWVPCMGKSKESLQNQEQENEDLRTEVTDEDLANAWTDEYGVMYSADRKRLLKAPKDIEVYPIKEGTEIVCNRAFKKCQTLSSISIPYGVLVIGASAFWHCNELKSIVIPDSVISIDKLAFFGCSGLESIKISSKLNSIGDKAFYACAGLTNITIPSNIKKIGESAFQGCVNLNRIIVDPNNMNYDSRNNCNAIIDSRNNTLILGCSSTIIPNTITKIGDESFFLCKNLKTISIPDSVKEIGYAAFPGCESLQSVTIPHGVEKLGNAVFLDCCSLAKVEIKGAVREIPFRLFYNCSALREVSIPQSITKISDEAFGHCSNMSSIFIPIGTLKQFEELLPDYKEKLVEQDNGWIVKDTRSFDPEEIAAVKRAEVVASQYGNSVCFFMNGGGQTYIPLCKQSKLAVGDELDLKTAKILTLSKKGKDDITRIIE